jgi:hypothetical protein
MLRTILLATVAALAFTTTTANAREPDTGCYARVYDLAHLAKHLDQLVMAIVLCLQRRDDKVAPDFTLDIKRRGDSKSLHTLGFCSREERSMLSCWVECDGGGFYVEFVDGYVRMYLNGRIRMQECGKEELDNGTGTEVTPGKDDKVFRLERD